MGRSLTGPGFIARTGDTMQGAFNEAKGIDIPSASSINLVTATGNLIDITGGNTIISMNLASGAERVLRFTGSLRLTNSATLVLPGGEDIFTLPGDFATVRGYPAGIVRVVVYTRATGFVQKIGDTLKGNLTLVGGSTTTPPLKYQPGVLTTLTVPHAAEWNGINLFMTNSSGVRKTIMFTDSDGSAITGLTSSQVVNALGYTPFNPGATPASISPAGGLLELGRYMDFHYGTAINDFDARLEVTAPSGSSGTSFLNLTGQGFLINGSPVWTYATLNNLNQLANGPGYALTNNPTFTGRVTVAAGNNAAPSIGFTGANFNTGIVGGNNDIMRFTSFGREAMTIYPTGVIFNYVDPASPSGGGQIRLASDFNGSSIYGEITIAAAGSTLRIHEYGGNRRGAYIDIAQCDDSVATRILTSKDIPVSSKGGSGYTKTMDGFIIQWGKRADGGNGAAYVAFPITFPNACVGLFTSYDMTNQRGSYGSGGSASQSGAYVYTDGENTWWLAIGY